ncbi:uncharacterized protein QC763_0113420 [Podospora pseudopauciseta]|uniref:Uncharacterized protein n=1 Tax=Podospora pseudopauciseta TaxID=2093780 RepID=A0ABR0GZS7_9PEZI|nr:hypothetical protein QC763_0113420 [Podospora pseudopauciseta]
MGLTIIDHPWTRVVKGDGVGPRTAETFPGYDDDDEHQAVETVLSGTHSSFDIKTNSDTTKASSTTISSASMLLPPARSFEVQRDQPGRMNKLSS